MNKPIGKIILIVCASIFVLNGSGLPRLWAQTAPSGGGPTGMQEQQAKKPAPAASKNGAPLYISPAAVVLVQQQLQQQGFDVQPIDGNWNRSTAQAIYEFQIKQGLDPTGNLNVATIHALGLPEVIEGTVERTFDTLAQKLSESKGLQLYISPSGIRRIQENLKQQDFYAGAVDGIWGPGTQQAIGKYEQEKGLQATGNINLRLINTLGLSQMVAGIAGETAAEKQPEAIARQEKAAEPGNLRQLQVRGYYGEIDRKFSGGAPLYVSPLAVRQVQMSLKQNGYDPGPIDGQWGSNTSRAIEQFQEARNLVPTGNLNITTARILLGGFELDSLPMGNPGSK